MTKIWECKIGECSNEDVPNGGDFPMRQAIKEAYEKLTGKEPDFCFSGWDRQLTIEEQEVIT